MVIRLHTLLLELLFLNEETVNRTVSATGNNVRTKENIGTLQKMRHTVLCRLSNTDHLSKLRWRA